MPLSSTFFSPRFAPWTHPLAWCLVWMLAHVAARVAVSPALEMDEAEQMLWTQALAWGYGSQPPLYTWLQASWFALVGSSVLGLSSLKFTLLGLTLVLVWRTARHLMPERAAVWAAASLLLLPNLGWESLRDLTHSVLLTCLVAATWWALLRQLRAPRPAGFALLGLVLGLGLLSKYSFALFAAALGGAVLSLPVGRALLRARGMWLLPLVALLTVLPHGLWLLEHWQAASAQTVDKLQATATLHPVARGLLSLVKAVLANLLLFGLCALAAFRSGWWKAEAAPAEALPAAAPSRPDWALPLFGRYLALLGLALVTLVVLGGVTYIKGRWLYPLLCTVPLMAFAWRPQLAWHQGGKAFGRMLLGVAVLVWVLLGLRVWANGQRGQPDELNEPLIALASALRAAGYDGHSPIVASDAVLGGQLRLQFLQAPVTVCQAPDPKPDRKSPRPPKPPTAACIQASEPAPGQGLLRIARKDLPPPAWWAMSPTVPAPTVLALPYQHAKAGQPPMRYHLAWQPPEPPSPRQATPVSPTPP